MTTTIGAPREKPESDTVTLEAIRSIVKEEIQLALQDNKDFIRTCIESDSLGVARRERPEVYSGEAEAFEGKLTEVHSVKKDKIPVPYITDVKVKKIYEVNSDKISQKCLLEDDETSIIITLFANNELPLLEKDGKTTYTITKLKTNVYGDTFSLNSTSLTEIIADNQQVGWKHDDNRIMDQLDLL
jgi:hypothetical protein